MTSYLSDDFKGLFDQFVASDQDFYVSLDDGSTVAVDDIDLAGSDDRAAISSIEDLIDNIYANNDALGSTSPWDPSRIQLGDSDSYISFEGLHGDPTVSGGVTWPDWSWNPLNWPGQVMDTSGWAKAGMDWGGSMILETGDKTGTFSLAETSIMSPISITYPIYPGIEASGTVGLDFKSDITIEEAATNKEIEFKFDQDFAARLNVSKSGFSVSEAKNDIEGSVSVVGSSDPITGLTFDAGLIPNVSASLGIGAHLPLKSPLNFGISIAKINADYEMPATFEFDPNGADLVIKNIIGGSADVLKNHIPGYGDIGWHFDIAETTLSTTTIPLA